MIEDKRAKLHEQRLKFNQNSKLHPHIQKTIMKFALDPLEHGYTIKAYESGWIQVNREKYYQSLLLMPDRLMPDWPVSDANQITTEHLLELVQYEPQMLLLGTGEQRTIIHPKIFAPLMELGIGYEVMTTGAACRTYNVLLSEDRRVLAALIP